MKKSIVFFIILVLFLGVDTVILNNDRNQNYYIKALSDSVYKMDGKSIPLLDKPGLNNPFNVGVDKNDFNNQILYDPSNLVTHIIDAVDYGMNGTDGLDDTLAFISIIEDVKLLEDEFVEIKLPSGDIDFIEGMNRKNRKFGIDLSGLSNVLISGNNTNVYFHGEIMGINMDSCKDVYIRNINIDWGRVPYSTATILENDGKTFKVEVHEGYPVDENTEIRAFLEFDKNAFIPRVKGNDIYGDVENVEYLGNQTLEITFKNHHKIAPEGTLVVLRHYLYEYDCFMINNSKNLYFENVNIYSAPGMGVRAYTSENMYFNRFNVKLKPNTDRLMSVTADAMHFIDCKGDLKVTNSLFENTGDDALNVHGMYLVITSIENSNTVYAVNPRGYNFKPDVGDEIEINDPHNMELYQTVTVENVEDSETGYKITFVEDLNSNISEGELLGNTTRTANLIFNNNVVRNKRCRGILVQTRKVSIENNTFANLSDAAILVTCDSGDWYESLSSRDIIIRNNKLLKNNYGLGGSQGDITVISFGTNYNIGVAGIQKNILIENNFISSSANSGIALNSAENVVVRHNLISNVGVLPKIGTYNSGIYMSNIEDVTLEKNNIISNSSKDFKMINLGAYVELESISVISNLGFTKQDVLGNDFSIVTEVKKEVNSISIFDKSFDDWKDIGTIIPVRGISDVDQNEVDLTEDDFKINFVKVTYDDSGIYYAFDVDDDDLIWLEDEFWNGDGFELFISNEIESYDPLNIVKIADPSCIQLFMNKYNSQLVEMRTSEFVYKNKEEILMNFWIKTDNSGYAGKGFIPFSIVPTIKESIDNNREFSFTYIFSDSDSDDARAQISSTYHPVELNKFVPHTMSKVIFKEEE